jgi:hypothetical protein
MNLNVLLHGAKMSLRFLISNVVMMFLNPREEKRFSRISILFVHVVICLWATHIHLTNGQIKELNL